MDTGNWVSVAAGGASHIWEIGFYNIREDPYERIFYDLVEQCREVAPKKKWDRASRSYWRAYKSGDHRRPRGLGCVCAETVFGRVFWLPKTLLSECDNFSRFH